MFFDKFFTNYKLSKFNLDFFKNKRQSKNNKILVEFYEFAPTVIPFSYYANALAEKYNAEINSYRVNFYNNSEKIKFYIKQILFNFRNLYKSFGCKKIILPNTKVSEIEQKYINKLIAKIKTKKNLLDLRFKNIPIGEYIYDEYLRSFGKITIDVHSIHFKKYFNHTLKLSFFWFKKLNPKIIKSLIISHQAYLVGLVGIIAIYKNIPTYRVSLSSSFLLTKKNSKPFCDFKLYPKIIKKIDPNVKNFLLKKSEMKIVNYFTKKNLDHIKIKKRKKNKRLNVLISAHCFTDAVHIHGKDNCFYDFYEWIDYLGKISNKIKNNWLVKLHPSEFDNNFNQIQYFLKKYPNLKLLPKKTKNTSLINKIDIVLTVYGTVGREFPLFNIPVINASTCGPHSGYNFNYHFKNKNEYNKAITNLKKYIKNFEINRREIFEFFYLRYNLDFSFLYNSNYINNINEKLRIKNMKPHNVVDIWLDNLNISIQKNIFEEVKKFILSKQYRFTSNNNDEFSKFMPLKKFQ